ncbi:MAG: DUF3783 domain-containing protein [Spirochaetales bacterium]|nr:DUF3783 domain-containing protein [Spirochaetales bacterium]
MSEIFIFRGFSQEDLDKGKNFILSKGINLEGMIFSRSDETMAKENVESLLNRINKEGSCPANGAPAEGSKAVIMAVNTQEKALMVMRSFKAVLDKPEEPAFAMITPTSLEWTLEYYMDHICQEHEYMKTHNPADDPDMKKITPEEK